MRRRRSFRNVLRSLVDPNHIWSRWPLMLGLIPKVLGFSWVPPRQADQTFRLGQPGIASEMRVSDTGVAAEEAALLPQPWWRPTVLPLNRAVRGVSSIHFKPPAANAAQRAWAAIESRKGWVMAICGSSCRIQSNGRERYDPEGNRTHSPCHQRYEPRPSTSEMAESPAGIRAVRSRTIAAMQSARPSNAGSQCE